MEKSAVYQRKSPFIKFGIPTEETRKEYVAVKFGREGMVEEVEMDQNK